MAPTLSDRELLTDLIAFHLEAGVDIAIGEEAVNRFEESAAERASARNRNPQPSADVAPARSRAEKASPPTPVPTAPPPPDRAAIEAREAAHSATTLDGLKELLEGCEGCPLRNTATQLVFGEGNPLARIMFVGEAPGRDEDIEGRPFIGRSGKLLDRMLASIGIARESTYIANVVPWRPPGDRTPTPQETAICLPFIRRQIELVDPDILVCLGAAAAQTLLGTTMGITKARGRWMEYDTGTRRIAALPTFHPAYLLRTPLGKRMAWHDLLALQTRLGNLPPRPDR